MDNEKAVKEGKIAAASKGKTQKNSSNKLSMHSFFDKEKAIKEGKIAAATASKWKTQKNSSSEVEKDGKK